MNARVRQLLRGRRPRVLACAGACLLVVGCGVPTDRAARTVPDEQVPFDLLSDSTTTTAPTAAAGTGPTSVCLTLDGALLPVTRRPGGGDGGLRELVTSPPSEGQTRVGLRSAVDDEVVDAVAAADGTATVDLDDEFGQLPGDEQLLAVAQMTCTLTAQPGIERVRFRLGGEHIDVPVRGGSLVGRAVNREDYEGLIRF